MSAQTVRAPMPKLRRPFRAVDSVASFTASVVNKGVDSCMHTTNMVNKKFWTK